MRCRGMHRVANLPFLGGFLFSGLLRVAPYCVRGGVRVVSKVVRSLNVFKSLLPEVAGRSPKVIYHLAQSTG
jgi:hypothetical protein